MGEPIGGRIFILGCEVMVQILNIPPFWFLRPSNTMSMNVTSKCGTSKFS
jgi:hypothetical protein